MRTPSQPPRFNPWWETPIAILVALLIMFAPVVWTDVVVPVFLGLGGLFTTLWTTASTVCGLF